MTRAHALTLVALCAVTPLAQGSGFTDHGQDLVPREKADVVFGGYLRVRGEGLYNLDLDRGLTPSGAPLYAVPLADPRGQLLTQADGRLRGDVAIYAPGTTVALKLRVDVFDNFTFGSDPAVGPGALGATPAATSGQRPIDALRIRRAYGEALTPVGLLAAGRMGGHWGLGVLSHGGDCDDCDLGDASDRLAFITATAGHIFAAAYDFSAVGPSSYRPTGRPIDVDPSDDVRTVSFAVLNWRDDFARERRGKAGKATFEYGALVSHRWQDYDVPASYLSVGAGPFSPTQVMYRGYRATAVDGWVRFTTGSLRVEAEAAGLFATVEQASLVPGALLRTPATGTQFGGALETEYAALDGRLRFGVDGGLASGDPAPGFGAFPGQAMAREGDLDGAQASFPRDTSVDNFRFHPDYRVDRILFRELIGTVTDAAYVRPHLAFDAVDLTTSRLTLSLAAIGSTALHAASTPSGQAPLGVEIDPTLEWVSRDGFRAALEYALLFPLAGLDNPKTGQQARPAQSMRLRLIYGF